MMQGEQGRGRKGPPPSHATSGRSRRTRRDLFSAAGFSCIKGEYCMSSVRRKEGRGGPKTKLRRGYPPHAAVGVDREEDIKTPYITQSGSSR